jgi:hypothetical protein
MCRERSSSGSAAGVAYGYAVYGPEDGISNLAEVSLTKRLDPLLPYTLHPCSTPATSQAPRKDTVSTLSKCH